MRNENTCGFYLKQLNDSLTKNANNALRKEDITMTQTGVLLYLHDLKEKEATLKELERAMKVAQSTTVGIISRMEQKGLVECFGSDEDKRIKIVRITSQGEEIYENSLVHMADAEKMLLNGFSGTEKTEFIRFLKKACNNLQ